MSEEKKEHRHHHSHSSSHSERSSGSHRSASKSSKSSTKSSSKHSKSKRNVRTTIFLQSLLAIAAIAFGILSGGNALYGVALYALCNIPLLILALYSLKLRKIPSYEYKADVYKHESANMLTISIPLGLVVAGVIFILGLLSVDHDEFPVDSLFLTLGGAAGLIFNGLSYYLLKHARHKTMATKTVYENSLVGLLISFASFAAGIALFINEEFINSDPYVTILISLIIIASMIWVTYNYVKKGFHMLPEGLEIEQIISTIKLNECVKNYRHLNIWTNNAEEVELSCHLSLDDLSKVDKVKREIKEGLRKMGIDVVTIAFKKHKEEYE